jgi:hypothetical protein
MAITISGSGITSANIADGTIVNADVADVAASKLTGALPALDGSALTGVGKVLQIVQGTTSTSVANSTNVYADTGLTATITPTSTTSKILVVYHQNGGYVDATSSNNGLKIRLIRDVTAIETLDTPVGWNLKFQQIYLPTISSSYLDSPSTTTATTYYTQFRNNANNASVYVQIQSCPSTITLMEIGV